MLLQLLSIGAFQALATTTVSIEGSESKAAKLLEMKANKKMVQLEMSQETGNVVLLRDLSNIMVSQRKGKTRNDIDASVKLLMDKYGTE